MTRPDQSFGVECAPARVEVGIWFAIGLIPFCSILRLPPDPMFWSQWATVVLFVLWLVASRRSAPADSMVVPAISLCFIGAAGLIGVHMLLGLTAFPASALIDTAALVLAFVVCIAARGRLDAGSSPPLLDAFAAGTIIALILNGVAVMLGMAGYELLGFGIWKVPVVHRAVGLIGQSNHLAMLAVLALAGAFFLRARGKLPKEAWWPLVGLGAFVCAASGSRIGIIVWVLLMLLVWWARRQAERRGDAAPLRAGRFDVAGMGLVLLVAQVGWISWVSTSPADSVARTDVFTRVELWQDAASLWWNHPLLGVGEGNFAAARLHELDGPLTEPNATHAHNLVMQALAEWGVLGGGVVLALGILVGVWVWRSLHARDQGPETFLVAAWLVCVLAHSLVEHPFLFARFLLPFAFMLGLLPQPVLRFERTARPRSAAMTAAAVLLILAGSGGAAWDYQRTQTLAMRLVADIQRNPDGKVRIPLDQAMRIRNSTTFPTFPQIMLARALPINADLASEKLDIVTRAMNAIPTSESMARYIAFSVVAQQEPQAVKLLESIRHRNDAVYERMLETLGEFGNANAQVAVFLAAHAPIEP